jgi:transposase
MSLSAFCVLPLISLSNGSVRKSQATSLSLEAAAQRLSVPKGTLANWVMAAKRGPTATATAPGSRSVAELEAENARLRRELAVERMEKDVLKKATAYFARESLPGTRN